MAQPSASRCFQPPDSSAVSVLPAPGQPGHLQDLRLAPAQVGPRQPVGLAVEADVLAAVRSL